MLNSFFLTTRNRGLYNKITEICKIHWELKNKEEYILKEIKLNKFFFI